MTQAQPPADPQTVEDATTAAAARLENEFGNNAVDGHVPPASQQPPAAAEEPFDIFDDKALDNLDFGNVPYRDGMKLRGEIQRAREQFRPFNDAFGSLSDAERQTLLDSAPTLGSDLATFSGVAGKLHPNDRQWFMDTMALMARDPQAGAAQLAAGADAIRESFGGQPPAQAAPAPGAPPPAADPYAPDPGEEPMTRAEFQQWQQERDEAQHMARLQDEILSEVRALGYSPDAEVGTKEYDDYSYLLAMAGRPDIEGDLTKADAIVKGRDQAVIDAYVNGKSADATRPAVPAIPGGQPASGERELSSFEDADAAMRSRLEAVLGPDPRRR
jgi:hypothetical protein